MKLRAALRLLTKSTSGWFSVLGQVFLVFALFSLVVSLFKIGISQAFLTMLYFYYGFREIIFWPFEKLFDFEISDTLRDILLIWSTLGGIAMTTFLLFTRLITRFALEALEKYSDPVAKIAYIKKYGVKKYNEERDYIKNQVEVSTAPVGAIFSGVTFLIGVITGGLAFVWLAIVNPSHERLLPLTAREVMAVQIAGVAIVLLAFCAGNYMLTGAS